MRKNKEISRRSMFRTIASVGASSALVTSVFPKRSYGHTKYAAAFALVGDRFHNSDYIRTALSKTLVEGAGLSIDFTDEVKLLSAETLQHYKMLIVFRDGMLWPDGYSGGHYPGWNPQEGVVLSDPPLPEIEAKPKMWLTSEQGRAVKEFVENGGAALFYHNTTHVALSSEDFADTLGATYVGHPPIRPFKVSIVNPDHPITRGMKDFVVTDEQHYFKYLKDPKYVLTRSTDLADNDYRGNGPSCEGGWAYDYGQGRVSFHAQGHMISVLWNSEYEKIQKNTVKWLLKEI